MDVRTLDLTLTKTKLLISVSDYSALAPPMSSQDLEQGEAEPSLTAAEENVLKRELLKRANIHATQVC